MKQVDFLYLSQEDILDMNVTLKQVIPWVEKGLKEQGEGRVENPPKPGIHALPTSFIHAMPAYFKGLHIGGIKWVSGYPTNRERGLPQILGLLVLNDMETGVPVCVMDCRWITAVRTAAVSAITAKYCARKNSSTLGIVGTGVQGRFNLLALREVLPGLRKAKIFDINKKAAENCKKDLEPKAKMEISIEKDVASVAQGSDIIITATQRLEKPLIQNEWFGKGCLGMGLEASRAWCGDTILKSDKFITDDWEQTKHFKSQGAFPDGLPELYAELGTIVKGGKPGREKEEERILAINIGLALEDIIVAHHLYEIAKDKNKYRRLPLMEKEF